MQTINLELARNKTKILADFLDDLAHVPSNAPGLQSYHAAKGVVHAGLRVGNDRRLSAARKALKQFNVILSIGTNPRGISAVRLYSPIKQTEIFL